MKSSRERVVVWFSCGAASAMAAKIAISTYPAETVKIVYQDTGSEHPDNKRFLADVEKWLGKQVIVLKHPKYNDTWEVWETQRYLANQYGAPCTKFLKKATGRKFANTATDLEVFGYTCEEAERIERFRKANPEVDMWAPLMERMINKADCLAFLKNAGIELPVMYRMGYRNNNCIGCVKGGMGYWNKIRKDFPEVFERMAELEERLGASLLRLTNEDGKRIRMQLKDLPPNAGNYQSEPSIECGMLCQLVVQETTEAAPQSKENDANLTAKANRTRTQ